ncbi:MAG: 6-hydroxymethylpterin diphosphokinase MptE-like protein [Nitrososphaeraceae archaeon]|jgi:2-amino-4-hydroxy-6-hydroxymethyldihydropteridine diphosphokinase
MKFVDWFPYYQDIRRQFGYSTETDQQAADVLSKLIRRKALDIKILRRKIEGKQIIVIGAGKSLENSTAFLKKNKKSIKIVADGAVQALIERKIKPDIVVTDLDGNLSFLFEAERIGAIMVVHAHSDNIDKLKKIIPKFKHVIGSTQMMPVKNVYNFGGFTDGDRCAFLAEEFGAGEIILVGMDFGREIGRYSKDFIKDPKLKMEKMRVARKLLEMLSKRSSSRLFDTSKRPIKGYAPYMVEGL